MPAKQYVDLNGITVYDEEIKDYIAGLGIGVTYTLTQDSQDPHKLILTPSQGTAQEVTVPDNNTTYALSVSGNNIVLTPSSGNADTITVPYATSAGNASTVGNHTVATDVPSGALFTDTTYSSLPEAQGGTAVSLVTTGEKYTWNHSGGGGSSATVLTATLAASATTVSFTNAAITNTARYDIYAQNIHDLSYENIVISGTTMTITFPAPDSAIVIKLVINEDS